MSKNSINYQSPSFYGLKMLLNELKVFLKFQLRRMKKVKRTPEAAQKHWKRWKSQRICPIQMSYLQAMLLTTGTAR